MIYQHMLSSNTIMLWIGNAENLRNVETIPAYFTQHEKERLQTFKFSDLKQFYAKVHLSVRVHLAKYLGLRIEEIHLRYRDCPHCGSSTHGAPYLDTPLGTLNFTLSKSSPYFVFGVAPFPLGVDIEVLGQPIDNTLISSMVFCEEELKLLENSQNNESALTWWVRKEAVLKAYGSGLCDSPSNLNVSQEIQPGHCVLEYRNTKWHIKDFDLAPHAFELSLAFAAQRISPRIKRAMI